MERSKITASERIPSGSIVVGFKICQPPAPPAHPPSSAPSSLGPHAKHRLKRTEYDHHLRAFFERQHCHQFQTLSVTLSTSTPALFIPLPIDNSLNSLESMVSMGLRKAERAKLLSPSAPQAAAFSPISKSVCHPSFSSLPLPHPLSYHLRPLLTLMPFLLPGAPQPPPPQVAHSCDVDFRIQYIYSLYGDAVEFLYKAWRK